MGTTPMRRRISSFIMRSSRVRPRDQRRCVGVEELDPPYIFFGSAERAEGMPDEVPRHTVECLLEIEEGHVYWLVLLQQQPDGVNRISSPASSNKSILIGTDGDDLPEMGVNYSLECLHGVAGQADRAVGVAFAEDAFAFPDRDCNSSAFK